MVVRPGGRGGVGLREGLQEGEEEVHDLPRKRVDAKMMRSSLMHVKWDMYMRA